MIYKASQGGEWPAGIHWTPGEVSDVPAGYPGADTDPPAWLKPVAAKAAPKAKGKAKPAKKGG